MSDGETLSEVEQELEAFKAQKQTRASALGFQFLFELYAAGDNLTSDMFHQAGSIKGLRVMRFRKGKLRVYCVEDPAQGQILLLTHAALKQANATLLKDLKRAYGVFNRLEGALYEPFDEQD